MKSSINGKVKWHLWTANVSSKFAEDLAELSPNLPLIQALCLLFS